MKWSKFFISICLLALSISARAQDSTAEDNPVKDRYEHHVELRQRLWASLIPNQFIIQNAGNMGVLSVDTGWLYGRNHWETQLLIGIIPKHSSTRTKVTLTLKENYIPWNIPFSLSGKSSASDLAKGWTVSPLTASLYINNVLGHEFWEKQPERYPDKYYEYMSTKFRLNIAIGQRITWEIPHKQRRFAKSITLFYEISSCDIYLRSKYLDSSVPLKDIIGLSLGVKLQTL